MAEQKDNALTLEGLAQKLNAQTLRLEALERENAELRSKVATLEDSRGSDTRRSEEAASALAFDGQVSRRSLLSKAGAAAVAAVAAGTLLNQREAKADHFGNGIAVDFVDAHNEGGNAIALNASAPDGFGVLGTGKNGVIGRSPTLGHAAVYGQHTGTSGYGVVGDGKGDGAGVLGRNNNGIGYGVHGKGTAYGVYGEGDRGVFGEGQTWGVVGKGDIFGVVGIGTEFGGYFRGDKAQLHLDPGASAGAPTTGQHSKGDIYMDSNATLFVCVAGGEQGGTWRRVQTAAA